MAENVENIVCAVLHHVMDLEPEILVVSVVTVSHKLLFTKK